MRLRRSAAAALGALALVLTVPNSASAAVGEFTYTYNDKNGAPHIGGFVDPSSRECLTLPEVAGEDVLPAHSPRNNTGSTAIVFTGANCDGDHFALRPNGGHASERLKLRSVLFS